MQLSNKSNNPEIQISGYHKSHRMVISLKPQYLCFEKSSEKSPLFFSDFVMKMLEDKVDSRRTR